MLNYHSIKPMLLGLVVLAGSIPAVMAQTPDVPVVVPSQGAARVWVLRPSASANGEVWGAAPIVYANGSPLGQISPNSAFYLDLPAGTYSFAVQPYGESTGGTDTVQLAPGSQTYLEVQWAPTWEMGYASGGRGDQSHAFFVLNMAPQLAQAYLQTLHYLGRA
jgi:hypothetical protein